MSKNRELQLLVHQYRDEVGRTDVDLHDVAEWGIAKGYLKMPKPAAPIDMLAKDLAKALREETKVDPETQRSYRVNHARAEFRSGKQVTLWGDIDQLDRDTMVKCFIQRRQQMVGDAVQLSDDVDHWNRVNPNDEPIQIEFDFGPDILWSKNSPEDMAS